MSFIPNPESSCSLTTAWPFPLLNGQIKLSCKQLDKGIVMYLQVKSCLLPASVNMMASYLGSALCKMEESC